MSENNGYADKATILSANKRRYRDVEVPLIGKVRIRSLTERERSAYEAGFLDKSGKVTDIVTGKIRLIILCVCNIEGHRLFSDADALSIAEMDAIATNALADACRKHSGFTDEDYEDLLKNSEATQGGGLHID